ncbi:hypothetical protein CL614_00230 [archaeon]|nr:hypothetical protein [archaeon]|tara:strand:+ start:419 stop:739 length:321 start_codon:yes stop_codon:yes gene_type:complete
MIEYEKVEKLKQKALVLSFKFGYFKSEILWRFPRLRRKFAEKRWHRGFKNGKTYISNFKAIKEIFEMLFNNSMVHYVRCENCRKIGIDVCAHIQFDCSSELGDCSQ